MKICYNLRISSFVSKCKELLSNIHLHYSSSFELYSILLLVIRLFHFVETVTFIILLLLLITDTGIALFLALEIQLQAT